MNLDVGFDAPATVSRFLVSDAFVRGIVGPVGSGKSSGCVMEILKRAVTQDPGPDGMRRTRFAVIRNTYPELRDTTRKTFEQWIPAQLGQWHEQEFTFRMRFGDVDCEVLFRALDTPRDVKKLLSLELTGAYINEAREVPKAIFDVLQTRVGRYPSKREGGPTWFGIWFDTNPWHHDHWLGELYRGQPEGMELFRQPGGRSQEAENVENLPPGYYERLCIGKDTQWVRVYVDGEEAVSVVGSIYDALLTDLANRGGLEPFEPEPEQLGQVFTAWDLGHGDSTAIWFWAFDKDRNVDFLNHYESHGQPMSHYFSKVKEFSRAYGYAYEKHFLPHDAAAKTLQTGSSIEEMARNEWGPSNVVVLPALSVDDGIGAARWLLEQSTRFHPECSKRHDDRDTDGLKCLRGYRWKWDEVRQTFSTTPLHDWTSHTSDAFRYSATVVKAAEFITRPRPAPQATQPKPLNMSLTLDGLFKLRDRQKERRERV